MSAVARNGRNERGRSRGRPPSLLGLLSHSPPYYGGTGPVPPHGQQQPPPYQAPDSSDGEHKVSIRAAAAWDHLTPPSQEIDCNGCFGGTFILLIVLAFISFYFLPTKISQSIDATAQLRIQQGIMKEETMRLEAERQSLERERLALKEERERWEKAHDNSTNVPQGAFWEVVWPRWECRAYGKREYWGILRNIPQDRAEIDACMNMPVEIKGVTVRRPERCQYEEGSPYVHGFWMVDWDQPDCKPWHQDFQDKDPSGGITLAFSLTHEFKGLYEPGIRHSPY